MFQINGAEAFCCALQKPATPATLPPFCHLSSLTLPDGAVKISIFDCETSLPSNLPMVEKFKSWLMQRERAVLVL